MSAQGVSAPIWADVLKELYDLSPWEKFSYYRSAYCLKSLAEMDCSLMCVHVLWNSKIPWKLMIHVLLTLMMSIGIFTDASSWSSYMISSQENFCYFFFPDACKDAMCSASHSMLFEECRIYSIDDVYDNIQAAVTNYYEINK